MIAFKPPNHAYICPCCGKKTCKGIDCEDCDNGIKDGKCSVFGTSNIDVVECDCSPSKQTAAFNKQQLNLLRQQNNELQGQILYLHKKIKRYEIAVNKLLKQSSLSPFVIKSVKNYLQRE